MLLSRSKRSDYWLTDQLLGDEGAKALSGGLKVNTTLTSLYLIGEGKKEKWRNKKKVILID